MARAEYEIGCRQIFVDNLKRILADKEILQKDLAKAVGVSTTTVCDWVKSRSYPRMERIIAIAEYLNINMSDLTEAKCVVNGVSNQEQEFLDLFNDISDEKKELIINLLKYLKEKPIPKEKQKLFDLYDDIPTDKKELAISLLNTLRK